MNLPVNGTDDRLNFLIGCLPVGMIDNGDDHDRFSFGSSGWFIPGHLSESRGKRDANPGIPIKVFEIAGNIRGALDEMPGNA